jgi:alpha-glucoside transport system permease protein
MSMKNKGKWIVNIVLTVICLLWLIPTVGLLVSSFKSPDDINHTPWWHAFPHKAWHTVETYELPEGTSIRELFEVAGESVTDRELAAGYELEDGRRLAWESRSDRVVGIQEYGWTMKTNYTLVNYVQVIFGGSIEVTGADGTTTTVQGNDLSRAFLNTVAVSVPSTLIPLTLATFAAYGFAWMKFRGKSPLFITMIAMLVIPAQTALVPIYRDFNNLGIGGTFISVWLVHAAFGLPLLTYFMHNYISRLPKDIFESAFIDGATHFTIFSRLILPLSTPAIASIGIFQFNWVWNDYLINLIFLGGMRDYQVLSMRLVQMVGDRGEQWHLLTSGAFVSMLLPLAIFFLMQKYFVRGLLGGSVKG